MSDSNELSILAIRRRELLARRDEARAVINEVDKELALNDATGDYLARLTGAAWPPAGEARAAVATKTVGVSGERGFATVSGHVIPASSLPTMPEMILSVLADAKGEGFDGLAPADIRDRIADKFKVQLPKDGVSPTVWRIWKKGRLVKVGDALYAAPPSNEKPADDDSWGNESAGLFPEQGREAGPGGGT